MAVRIARFLDGARGATGAVAIVDVFRAFTTAAFCVAQGAREIVLVAHAEEALALKQADPLAFLTGEIGGQPITGFDVGNSPSAIEHLDLAGRRVVQRTSAGTQGVVAAARADAIYLSSLVTLSATADALRRAPEVTIVAMGHEGTEPAIEDEACAALLAATLAGDRPDPAYFLRPLSERGLRPLGGAESRSWPEWFPRRDAELACQVDRFDFALAVSRESGLLVARPVRQT